MILFNVYLLILYSTIFILCEIEKYTPIGYEETTDLSKIKLFRWDPVRIGYEREIDLGEGIVRKMVTKSLNPPIFTMENFLTHEECDYLIDTALKNELVSSNIHRSAQIVGEDKIKLTREMIQFDRFDTNEDGIVAIPTEIHNYIAKLKHMFLNDEEVIDIFQQMEAKLLKRDEGYYLDRNSFQNLNFNKFYYLLDKFKMEHPHHRIRYSEQAWVNIQSMKDKIYVKMFDKMQKITNLHEEILYGMESLQIARYQKEGHYHAHYDSTDKMEHPNTPCHQTVEDSSPIPGRLCRFLTVMYYLNDVEKGGETAFPKADKSEKELDELFSSINDFNYNLNKFCYNSSIVVKPKKGSIIMWYNHRISENGFMGSLEKLSYHGGCTVREGEKWIGTHWIAAPERYEDIRNSKYRPDYFDIQTDMHIKHDDEFDLDLDLISFDDL